MKGLLCYRWKVFPTPINSKRRKFQPETRKGAFCRPAAELDGELVVAAFFNLRRRFCGLWAFCLTWAALQDLRTCPRLCNFARFCARLCGLVKLGATCWNTHRALPPNVLTCTGANLRPDGGNARPDGGNARPNGGNARPNGGTRDRKRFLEE